MGDQTKRLVSRDNGVFIIQSAYLDFWVNIDNRVKVTSTLYTMSPSISLKIKQEPSGLLLNSFLEEP